MFSKKPTQPIEILKPGSKDKPKPKPKTQSKTFSAFSRDIGSPHSESYVLQASSAPDKLLVSDSMESKSISPGGCSPGRGS